MKLSPLAVVIGKTIHSMFAALASSALLALVGTAQAIDNTGTGGTITYTDSSGLNPVASPPYIGGFVVHKFTASGTLDIPVPATANVLGGRWWWWWWWWEWRWWRWCGRINL